MMKLESGKYADGSMKWWPKVEAEVIPFWYTYDSEYERVHFTGCHCIGEKVKDVSLAEIIVYEHLGKLEKYFKG